MEEKYNKYSEIVKDGINKNNFNKYLENKINDESFIEYVFKEIFSIV
ncbi:MAG: hypothetical protein ACI4ON_05655 [Clostridia bacterium]